MRILQSAFCYGTHSKADLLIVLIAGNAIHQYGMVWASVIASFGILISAVVGDLLRG